MIFLPWHSANLREPFRIFLAYDIMWKSTRGQQPVRSEWHIQDGGQLSKIVPSLPAIAHKFQTSTATKFEMSRLIFPRKCFLLFLALGFSIF